MFATQESDQSPLENAVLCEKERFGLVDENSQFGPESFVMWQQCLNRAVTQCEIGTQPIEIIGWAYQLHLPSNIAHRHSYFEACLVGEHGQGNFHFDGESHPLTPHTFFLARPGQIHQIINTASPDMELFWVSFALPPGAKGEHANLIRDFTISSLSVVPKQEVLLAQWNALRTVAQQKWSAGNEWVLKRLAEALLFSIIQISAASTEEAPTDSHLPTSSSRIGTKTKLWPHELNLHEVRSHQAQLARLGVRYIGDNLDRPLSIEELCHHLGVSRRQISRLFLAYTGVTPAAYIERARLDRAMALLLNSSQSIKAIAHAVGYADVHHFTRVFARVVGTPPGEYRTRGGPRVPLPSGPNIQIPGSLV